MASRRVELAKQLKLQGGSGASGVLGGSGFGGTPQQQQQTHQSNVQINTSVDDTQKSIDELINAGVAGARVHEHNRNNHFQRKKMPLSFFNPRAGGKSRGSSTGHSREGSSDDGGGGRHTLSPSASGAFAAADINGSFGTITGALMPGGVVHQRQASAPALINYNIIDQQQQIHHQPPSNRARPIPGNSAAGLPPVAHFHSKSLNTVIMNTHMPTAASVGGGVFGGASGNGGAAVGMSHDGGAGLVGGSTLALQQTNVYGSGGGGAGGLAARLPPVAHHQRSVKSCDFDAVGIGAIQQNFGGFEGSGAMELGGNHFNAYNYHPQSHSHYASHQRIHQQPYPHPHPQQQQMTQSGLQHVHHIAAFHSQPHEMTTGGTAGDPAAGATLEFYANKPQHAERNNMCWMDPRGKSQSLDPITLTAAAEGASPLAPGASPCSAITAPGSIASVHSSTTPNSQKQQQQHHHQQQQFVLQQQQQSVGIASCSGTSMEEGLGPLPEGWAMSYDQNGDPYFIDHINKTTTWYDPRISKEAQEETIKMRHAFLQKTHNNNNNNDNSGGTPTVVNSATSAGNFHEELKRSPTLAVHHPHAQVGIAAPPPQQQQQLLSPQQQQTFDAIGESTMNYQAQQHGSPGAAMDRIRQLKMERSYMLERRQQLCREGLLDRVASMQQQQQMGQQASSSKQQQQQQPAFFLPLPNCSHQPVASSFEPAAPSSSASMNDSAMDVDFQQGGPVLHHLDPSSLVPEFAGDLNPHEFDKYLQITDNNRQFGVMR